MFLVLMIPVRNTALRLPSPVGRAPSAPCPEAHVEVASEACTVWEPEVSGHFPRSFSCDPRDSSDEAWTATLILKAEISQTCRYELLVVNSPRTDITTGSHRYPHVDVLTDKYVVHGKPWGTYAAAPIWRSGEQSGFAGEMILVGFYQQQGSNIRGSALLLFIAQIAVTLAIILVIYWFLTRDRTRTGSWIFVALVSAGGGTIAGVLFVLRPPDLGGYDEPLAPVPSALLISMLSGTTGITGCLFAWVREQLDRMSPGRRLLLTSLVILFVALITHVLTTKWSAYSRPGSIDLGEYAWTVGDLYFATSMALPLVLFHETDAHTSETAEVHSRVLRLFGIAALSGLFEFLVEFTIKNALDVAYPGLLFRGYYKPAGSVGLWLVSLVIIAALSFALVTGTQPRWIQDLNEALSRFADAPDPSARLRDRQRILKALFAHEKSIDVQGRRLGFVARQAPRVIQPLLDQPQELAQFVTTLEPSGATRMQVEEARQRFIAVREKLKRIDRRESKIEVPLLLIDEGTRGLVHGKLGVTRFFDPAARRGAGVDVCQKGVPLEPEHPLRKHVQTLVALVDDRIVSRIRGDAFDRHRIEVDFQYEEEADLSGASYELPLALAMVGFLVEDRPIWESWAATGQINRDTLRIDVGDLDIKCAFLAEDETPRILVSAASAMDACQAAPNTISCLNVRHCREFEKVRQKASDSLTHGRSVLLGVSTLEEAVEILYGMSVMAAKS